MAKTDLKPTIAAPNQGDWFEKAKSAPHVEAETKILQTITFKIGTFDDEARTFRAVASSACVDRSGDVIEQEGWDVSNFMVNPVIPWCHDYYQLPVARAIEVGVSDGVLQFTYQAPPKGMYPFADTVWDFYRNQYMFAFSVGFIPEEPEEGYSWSGNTYRKCELLEISAVLVPANPQALALAYKSGKIDLNAAKMLMDKTASAMKSLSETLKAESEEVAKEAEIKATEMTVTLDAINAAVKTAVAEALAELNNKGEENNSESLTPDEGDEDNDDMKKSSENEVDKKDLGENSNGGGDLAPLQSTANKKGMGAVCDAIHDVADTLKAHADALTDHAKTMSAHSAMIAAKADVLHKSADYVKDLLDHNGDETSEETDSAKEPDNASGTEGDGISGGKSVDEKAKTKDVEVVSEDSDAEADHKQEEEAGSEDDVTAEVVSEDSDASAGDAEREEKADESNDSEKADDKEAEADSGEVKSEDESSTDGADHADAADEELVDEDNLTDEQIKEILDAVNAESK